MSKRDNFYQAFKELLGQEPRKSTAPSGEEAPTAMENPPTATERADTVERVAAPEPEPAVTHTDGPDVSPPEQSQAQQTQDPAGDSQSPYEPPIARGSDEMTVISRNTMIDGNIRSFANLTVEGSVRGNVDTVSDVLLQGRVVGTLRCNNVEMRGSSMQGDVQSKGRLRLDVDTLVLGNLSAQCAEVDGKVRGNMEISGRTEFHPNAVVLGDVRTSSIIIAEGANIQGFIDTSYLRENVERVFPKQVVIDEEF